MLLHTKNFSGHEYFRDDSTEQHTDLAFQKHDGWSLHDSQSRSGFGVAVQHLAFSEHVCSFARNNVPTKITVLEESRNIQVAFCKLWEVLHISAGLFFFF